MFFVKARNLHFKKEIYDKKSLADFLKYSKFVYYKLMTSKFTTRWKKVFWEVGRAGAPLSDRMMVKMFPLYSFNINVANVSPYGLGRLT